MAITVYVHKATRDGEIVFTLPDFAGQPHEAINAAYREMRAAPGYWFEAVGTEPTEPGIPLWFESRTDGFWNRGQWQEGGGGIPDRPTEFL